MREGGIAGSSVPVRPEVVVTDADGGVNSDVTVVCSAAGDDACDAFDVETVKLADGKFQGLCTEIHSTKVNQN